MSTPTPPATNPPPLSPTRRQKLLWRSIAALLIVAVIAVAAGFAWQHREYPLALLRGQVNFVGGSSHATPLHLPPGFTAEVYASGLSAPRFLTFGPDGVLYVAESAAGRVTALPMDRATGKAARHVTVASGLQHPTSLAFMGNILYVGETSRVTRMTIGSDMSASGQQRIITDLPNSGIHITRTVLMTPATCRTATGRCPPPWRGATTCSARRSGRCSGSSRCSSAAGRWRPPGPSARSPTRWPRRRHWWTRA